MLIATNMTKRESLDITGLLMEEHNIPRKVELLKKLKSLYQIQRTEEHVK